MRVFEGMKKVAGSATLWALGHTADSVPPRHQVDEFAVELPFGRAAAAVPASLQIPPSPGRLSFRVILDIQIATQMDFGVAATFERFDSAKRFQILYHILVEFAKVKPSL